MQLLIEGGIFEGDTYLKVWSKSVALIWGQRLIKYLQYFGNLINLSWKNEEIFMHYLSVYLSGLL